MRNQEHLKLEIGKRIDYIRVQRKMTKNEFAKFISVTVQHLSNVINGTAGLSLEKVIEISDKTGYTTDFILRGQEKPYDKVRDNISNLEKEIEYSYNIIKTTLAILK